jgi:hypothetical protein
MKNLLITAWLLTISMFQWAQIYEPEGINMPGSWNSWSNAPTNVVLGNPNQVSGGTLAVTGFGTKKWQTKFSVAASGGNLVGGAYEFKFSSGPSSNYWNNFWGGTAYSLNTLQATSFGASANNSITLTNGKWYTMNWIDIGYANTQAIFMETSAQPITVSGITQFPSNGNVTSADAVALTITANAAPSSEELTYIRYSIDGFSTSTLAPVTFTGSSGMATIPAQSAGAVVAYYLFTTTLSNPAITDADKVSIHQHRNGAVNYTYNVNTPVPPVNVTFQINMSQEYVGGAVNIAGSFNGFTPTAMTNSGGGIYTYTTAIPQNTNITFKYLNGATFESNMGAPCGDGTNRTYAIGTSDVTIPLICWNSCSACPPTHNVTFQVNMNDAIVSGNGVHIAGSFQGWNPATTAMSDVDADGIYTITLVLAEGVTYPFKYINGNAWGNDENVPGACNSGGNRSITVGTSDITISPVCFGLCSNCPTTNYNVTFAVNMNLQTVSANGVHVAGSFQGWDPAATALTDPDSDGIYTAIVSVPENSSFTYKFVNGNAWGGDESVPGACNSGGNRSASVTNADVVLPTVCFGLCNNCPNGNYNVTFQVDMNDQVVSAQGVHLAGSFQGWDPSSTPMSDANADGIYTLTLSLAENTTYQFKFVNGNAWGQDESVPGACNNAGNRSFNLASADITLGIVCFSACTGCGPNNDHIGAAQTIPGYNAWYPQCATYSGSCVNANNSSESTAYTGPDVWYSFLAELADVSIQVNHSGMDAAIQLVDADLNPVIGGSENASSATSGMEILNFSGLNIGQVYYVSVGAASGIGGDYSMCIKQLIKSGCNTNVSQPLNICSTFKPKWTGANSYTITFTPQLGSNGGGTITAPGSLSLGNSALGLIPGNVYDVRVDANYTSLQNALGDDIDITVLGNTPSCVVTIAPHVDIQVRPTQRCSAPATLMPYSFLRTDPFSCGVSNYTYQFTPVVGCNDDTPTGLPFTSTYHSRILPLTLPNGTSPANQTIQAQSYYSVRIRPNFGLGGINQGTFGTAQTIFVGGSVLDSGEFLVDTDEARTKELEMESQLLIYPNPLHGNQFVLQAFDLQENNVSVRIFDQMGRIVYEQPYTVDQQFQTIVNLPHELSKGLYSVQIMDGKKPKSLLLLVD